MTTGKILLGLALAACAVPGPRLAAADEPAAASLSSVPIPLPGTRIDSVLVSVNGEPITLLDVILETGSREKELAGKKLNYKVKVLSVQHRGKLTDEELLANTGAKTMDELRDMFRKELEMEAAAKRRREANEAVYKKLDEAAGDFELPAGLLEAEIQKELQKLARETVRSEADAEKFKSDLEAHKTEAEKSARPAVRRMLILRKLAQLEKITVSDGELNAQVAGMSRYYGYKPNALRNTLRKSGAIEDLRFDIMSAKALDKLVAKVLG